MAFRKEKKDANKILSQWEVLGALNAEILIIVPRCLIRKYGLLAVLGTTVREKRWKHWVDLGNCTQGKGICIHVLKQKSKIRRTLERHTGKYKCYQNIPKICSDFRIQG